MRIEFSKIHSISISTAAYAICSSAKHRCVAPASQELLYSRLYSGLPSTPTTHSADSVLLDIIIIIIIIIIYFCHVARPI